MIHSGRSNSGCIRSRIVCTGCAAQAERGQAGTGRIQSQGATPTSPRCRNEMRWNQRKNKFIKTRMCDILIQECWTWSTGEWYPTELLISFLCQGCPEVENQSTSDHYFHRGWEFLGHLHPFGLARVTSGECHVENVGTEYIPRDIVRWQCWRCMSVICCRRICEDMAHRCRGYDQGEHAYHTKYPTLSLTRMSVIYTPSNRLARYPDIQIRTPRHMASRHRMAS